MHGQREVVCRLQPLHRRRQLLVPSATLLWRECHLCSTDSDVLVKPHHDEDFATNILQRFRRSEAGQLCMTDELIQQVGFRHYCLRRCYQSKIGEVRKNVMQEMREMARLFLQLRCVLLYYLYYFSMNMYE